MSNENGIRRDTHLLSFAWFGYASERMREEYRNAGNTHRSLGLQYEMRINICSKLEDGELRAFGFQVQPNLSDSAVEIPQFLFESESIEIDWEKSTVSSLGRRFEDVRVAPYKNRDQPSNFTEIQILSPDHKKRKGGRYNTYAYSYTVIQELFEAEGNKHLSAEKLYPAFKSEFERRFPRSEFQITVPSVRTLREQLKRLRQKPAGIGNN